MELRHLRYFVAVAEEGSLSVAAQKRLHTAQPSLSRQIHDLELELGVQLFVRGPRGIDLTPSGRVFLDHARVALLQVEAAAEAARRAGQPAKSPLSIGFLTGYEMDWLPAVMDVLRGKLSSAEITIRSEDSPDLAAALIRGKIDLAFMRAEKNAPGLQFKLLRHDPVLVVMPKEHELAARSSVRPKDLARQSLIGVSPVRAPTLRAVVEDFYRRNGLTAKPAHQAENLAMAVSLVASTGSVSLLPLYAQNFLPKNVVSRPIQGAAPMIDLVLGYNETNNTPLLRFFLSKLDQIKFQALKREVG